MMKYRSLSFLAFLCVCYCYCVMQHGHFEGTSDVGRFQILTNNNRYEREEIIESSKAWIATFVNQYSDEGM